MDRRILLLILLLWGFRGELQAVQWTDAVGRKVAVGANPQRIVSLVPSVTEMLFAYGLSEKVVGVTRYCDYPPDARQKPLVGEYANPSLERLLSLAPDLVIASADMTQKDFIAKLDDIGIPAYVIYPRSLSETVSTMREVGAVVGAPDAGKALAQTLQQDIEAVKTRIANQSHPSVLVCVMLQPFVVAGPRTLADDLIQTAGGKNVVPKGPLRFPTWGPEALLLANPDVIVVSSHLGEPDPIGYFKKWPELKAVQSGKVIVVNPDLLHRPGPRLGEGLRLLADALHGSMEKRASH